VLLTYAIAVVVCFCLGFVDAGVIFCICVENLSVICQYD